LPRLQQAAPMSTCTRTFTQTECKACAAQQKSENAEREAKRGWFRAPPPPRCGVCGAIAKWVNYNPGAYRCATCPRPDLVPSLPEI
jgi:hypothetical protein